MITYFLIGYISTTEDIQLVTNRFDLDDDRLREIMAGRRFAREQARK